MKLLQVTFVALIGAISLATFVTSNTLHDAPSDAVETVALD